MRLTCPKCGAQYEVPETAIPEAGRDVQCSACGETWVQHHPGATPAAAEDSEAEPDAAREPHPTPEPAQRRLDPEVADILRTEAARERAKRAAESTGGVGMQVDPASTAPSDPSPAPPLQGVRRATDDAPSPASRQGTLPDPEDINSSLTPARGRAERDLVSEPLATSVPARQSGFGVGFWIAMIAFGLAACVYLWAPDLVALVPEAEAPVERYVAAIDGARLRLDAFVDRMMTQITGG